MANDIDFNEAGMRQLKLDIEQELMQVKELLNNVSECCATEPGENDTVLNAIKDYGATQSEAWTNLCNTFSTIGNKLGEAIGNYAKVIAEKLSEVTGLKKGC